MPLSVSDSINTQKITPITVSYGDGDGPEIMEHILTILQHADARIAINSIDIGENFYKREYYSGIPDSAWKTITAHPVIFMAPSKKPQGSEYHDVLETLCRSLELHTTLAPLSHQMGGNMLIGRNESAFQHNIAHRLQSNVVEEMRLFTDKQTQNLVNHACTYARLLNYRDVHSITYSPTALSAHRLKEIADASLMAEETLNYYEFNGSISTFLAQDKSEKSLLISQESGLLNSLRLMQDVQRRGLGFLGENYLLFSSASHVATFEGQLHAAILMLLSLNQPDIASLLHHAWAYALDEHADFEHLSYDDAASAILRAIDDVRKNGTEAIYRQLLQNAPRRLAPSSINQDLIGVEFTIASSSQIEDTHKLIEIAQSCCENTNLKPQTIQSRGFAIWPNPTPYQFDANDYITLRFMSDKTPKTFSHDDVSALMIALAESDISITALRHLYLYDEHIGFSF